MKQKKSKNTETENKNHMWNPLKANGRKAENKAVVAGNGDGSGIWAENRK